MVSCSEKAILSQMIELSHVHGQEPDCICLIQHKSDKNDYSVIHVEYLAHSKVQ